MVLQDELDADEGFSVLVEFDSFSSSSSSSSSFSPPPSLFLSFDGQLPIFRPNNWIQNLGTLISMFGGKTEKHPKHMMGSGVSKGKITEKVSINSMIVGGMLTWDYCGRIAARWGSRDVERSRM